MPETTSRRGSGAVIGIALLIGALLSGCASTPDPGVARESLEAVTEDPSPADADKEYDAERRPEPVVEPLECSEYLVITARGTGEPSRGQLLSPVARAISEARPGGVETLDLDYPADTDVKEGGTRGARVLIDTLNLQAEECEDQRFVLLGYSQGALVVGDALSAPDARLVGSTVGVLGSEAAGRVAAVVFYGDPRFLGSEPYNAGTFRDDLGGLLPRPAATLDAFSDRILDLCVARDFVCQSRFDLDSGIELDEDGHVEYFDNGMQERGADFVIDRLDRLDRLDGDPRSRSDPDSRDRQASSIRSRYSFDQ